MIRLHTRPLPPPRTGRLTKRGNLLTGVGGRGAGVEPNMTARKPGPLKNSSSSLLLYRLDWAVLRWWPSWTTRRGPWWPGHTTTLTVPSGSYSVLYIFHTQMWWASAMNLSLYFRALIFYEENKGLIVIWTFYFNGALISWTVCSMQQVTSFQIPTKPLLFPGKSTL